MVEDYKVKFDEKVFDCVDFGFKENKVVDVLIRPEDIKIVNRTGALMKGEVKSVLFKGVHYEIIVETISGASKTFTMHILSEHDTYNQRQMKELVLMIFMWTWNMSMNWMIST